MDQQADNSKEDVTVVNTAPTQKQSGDNGMGFLLGVIVLIVLGLLFFVYGLPYVRNLTSGNGVQVNIPDKIDVNVNQSK